MSQNAFSRRFGEITIDSNWIMTVGMALLFVFCGALLIWNIRDFLFDKVDHDVSLIYVAGAVYSFLFAYSFPAKHLKVAFLLLGTDYTVRVALGYLHASATVQHSAAVVGSIARQIAMTIIFFAMARWFKSVVRWIPPSNPGVADS